jgi:hypothetical protein
MRIMISASRPELSSCMPAMISRITMRNSGLRCTYPPSAIFSHRTKNDSRMPAKIISAPPPPKT